MQLIWYSPADAMFRHSMARGPVRGEGGREKGEGWGGGGRGQSDRPGLARPLLNTGLALCLRYSWLLPQLPLKVLSLNHILMCCKYNFHQTQVDNGHGIRSWIMDSLTCLSIRMILRLEWCDSGWWRYQLNATWWLEQKAIQVDPHLQLMMRQLELRTQ